ncbi:MAG: GxxExxY protein [Coxiella sp. (in: Bacteria)]|nr:MAG: GxxExxY protein [Coxiella sp. (in: g-proteobacteria)]
MNENKISNQVINCAIEIHRHLGPGLLESTYEALLEFDLSSKGLIVERQVVMAIKYKSIVLEKSYIADMIINKSVILEIKSIERNKQVHRKQLLTYLKTSNIQLGLLLNFGLELMKDGIHRVVNNL